ARRVDPVDLDLAAVRAHQRVEHAQGGGLAGAVGAEQAGDLAVAGLEAHAGHGLHRAGAGPEALVEVSGDDHRRTPWWWSWRIRAPIRRSWCKGGRNSCSPGATQP